MTKMFKSITRTWNPYHGCRHACSYCWARKLAEGRLQSQGKKYAKGFEPELLPSDLEKHFKPGERIFVCAMGDLFGKWVPNAIIQAVIDVTAKWPETEFLFMTKRPSRYHSFHFSRNTILGTTVESDLQYPDIYDKESQPESTWERMSAMRALKHPRKFISIEPIMYFSSALGFAQEIATIFPELVEIGADNYHNGLPEPSREQVANLLSWLRSYGLQVNEKEGLERLTK